MILKKTVAAVLLIAAIEQANARVAHPTDVHGRALSSPVGGHLGHTGIATRGMFDPSGMYYPAYEVIEVLNENPVIQINSMYYFQQRSAYWGSRLGIANLGPQGYNMLVEANHQRWWCPKYTYLPWFEPGQGIPTNGTVIKCGTWRCDNYVWWLYNSFGFPLVPSGQFNPSILFYALPFANSGQFMSEQAQGIVEERALSDVTAEELNSMEIERLERIIGNPEHNTVKPKYVEQLRVAKDKSVKDIIRGGMLDVMSITANNPRVALKMIAMFKKEESGEVRFKVVQNVMTFNQRHGSEELYIKDVLPKVRAFFEMLMLDKSLETRINNDALRGFIDTHTSQEIIAKKELVEIKLANLESHEDSIMLKSALMFKSPELQKLYTESLVQELRKANNSDLDSYLFGPLSLAYKAHPEFLIKESADLVVDYLNEVQFKYTSKGINENQEDFTRSTTAPYHAALSQALGVK